MNLIEFKRLCQLKQNYDYIFINADESELTNIYATQVGTITRDKIEIKPEFTEQYIEAATITIKDDIKLIEIRFTQDCTEFAMSQITEAIHICTDSQYRYCTIGQIQHREVVNVVEVGFDEFYHMHLGLIAKNEIVVNLSRFSFTYQLILNQLILAEGKNLNYSSLWYSNALELEVISADPVDKYCYLTAIKDEQDSYIVLSDGKKIKLSNSDEYDISGSADVIETQLITISYKVNDKFLTKLNVTEVANSDIELPIINTNTSSINIGRKSLLSDYSNSTLSEMSIDEKYETETTLEDINYIII